MRMRVRVLAVLGLLALFGGIVALAFGGAFLCFGVCNSHLLADMIRLAVECLAPGALLTGSAWWLALTRMDRARYARRFGLALWSLPIVLVVITAALLILNGGWILPANEAQHIHWTHTNGYVYLVLLLWPLAVLIGSGALPRRRDAAEPMPS